MTDKQAQEEVARIEREDRTTSAETAKYIRQLSGQQPPAAPDQEAAEEIVRIEKEDKATRKDVNKTFHGSVALGPPTVRPRPTKDVIESASSSSFTVL